MKKQLSLCLIFVFLLASITGCVMPKGEFHDSIALYIGSHVAYVNGEQGYIDADNYFVTPFVDEQNRTQIPLRYLAESLGGSVKWDGKEQTAEFTFSGRETECKSIVVTLGKNTMLVDGKEMPLDTAATHENDRIFVPLRAIAEAVGRRVFYDNGLILINKYELVYEAERDRDLLDSLVRDNFSNKKIVELPGAMEPNEENVEPAKHFENVDYQAVYKTFYEKHLTPVVGKRSGMLPQIDQKNMNWQGYQAEPGFVCSLVCDMDEDGITELVTVQEYADEDISGAEGVENTSLQVKIYRVAENQIVCLDSVEIRQLLPLFSFVDVTFSNQKLFISGIGAWAGDPGYNSHHVISFAENKLTHETVSSLDVYTVGMYEQLEEEEKQAAEATLARLQELGFSYKEVDDLVGGCNLSAQRLALYSLFGKEGRFAEYFKGTFELQQGFFDYTVNVQP